MRTYLHIPHGILAVLLLYAYPHIGWAFLLAFLLYELWQGFRTQDAGFQDLKSTLYGMAIAGIGVLIYGVFF